MNIKDIILETEEAKDRISDTFLQNLKTKIEKEATMKTNCYTLFLKLVMDDGRISKKALIPCFSTLSEPLFKQGGINIHINGDDALVTKFLFFLDNILKEGSVVISDK